MRGMIVCLMLLMFAANLMAGSTSRPADDLQRSDRMEQIAKSAADEALEEFKDKNLQPTQLAVSVIDLHDADAPKLGSFRGSERIYPASVVKLFYLAAAHRWLEDGKLQNSEELRGELRKMIVV